MLTSFLLKIKRKLDVQGGFLKAVSVLMGGTAFAQLLSVLITPLLTRLYSPNDFALLAIYISLHAIFSVIC